jgi:hypothetical protein
MKKKLFYTGIILVVAALAAFFFAVPALAVPSQLVNVTPKSVAITAGSSAYVPVFLNQTGIVTAGYNASGPLAFYLVNASAFRVIGNASSSNLSAVQEAKALEGRGVFELYANSTKGVYPYYANYSAELHAPDYQANVSPMPQGYYYVDMFNPGNAIVTAAVSVEPITVSQLQSTSGSIGDGMLIVGIIFVLGIAIIVYSVFSKPKQQAQGGGLDAEVARAYDQIEKKGAGGAGS